VYEGAAQNQEETRMATRIFDFVNLDEFEGQADDDADFPSKGVLRLVALLFIISVCTTWPFLRVAHYGIPGQPIWKSVTHAPVGYLQAAAMGILLLAWSATGYPVWILAIILASFIGYGITGFFATRAE
jgi:hypothetical protein